MRQVDFDAACRRFPGLAGKPVSTRILLENLLRHDDGTPAHRDRIAAVARGESVEIDFRPARVLMQDYAGMPALIDLAGLRSSAARRGLDPASIHPQVPVDLVVDHSVMADISRVPDALRRNLEREYAQNAERYRFLKWAAGAFDNLRIVPPGQGIVHQINTEDLASVVTKVRQGGTVWRVPDTLVGTDSHTTMVNGLGVLGWGVGGIEAEAVMLGEPISILAPPVVAVELRGALPDGCLATDAVLSLTEFLRAEGVVGTIVEFFGSGCASLAATDRLTIANMAPEFGSTAAFFATDDRTLDYLRATGRDPAHVRTVQAYLKQTGLFFDHGFRPDVARVLRFDLSAISRVVAGPRRPEERRALSDMPGVMTPPASAPAEANGLKHGDIVIASITSCTNTANPEAMVTAGLLARAARRRGLTVAERIKTSLAPGSRRVSAYLDRLGLLDDLAALGFDIVAYGCTTCVGNSGDLAPEVSRALETGDLTVASVLSGNRNFEARIHPRVKANFLASPPLVIAYALAGTMRIDLETDPVGHAPDGAPVYLEDLWPSRADVSCALEATRDPGPVASRDRAVFEGGPLWASLDAPAGSEYDWDPDSTYLRPPPFFDMAGHARPGHRLVADARPLLVLPDMVTTDHISPVGRIAPDSAAAAYLTARGVAQGSFNAYGARRGDHDVMTRGTFANVRLDNRLADRRGGITRLFPDGTTQTVYDAAETYRKRGESLVVLAGRNYGVGSARDWAAKGTRLLGIEAVIALSFERIHRANLVRLGVMPIIADYEGNLCDLPLGSDPRLSVSLKEGAIVPKGAVAIEISGDGPTVSLSGELCIETLDEVRYFEAGGILPFVARRYWAGSGTANRAPTA